MRRRHRGSESCKPAEKLAPPNTCRPPVNGTSRCGQAEPPLGRRAPCGATCSAAAAGGQRRAAVAAAQHMHGLSCINRSQRHLTMKSCATRLRPASWSPRASRRPVFASAAPRASPRPERGAEAKPRQDSKRRKQASPSPSDGKAASGGGKASSPSGWCDVQTAPAWRVFGVNVPGADDPGKDDFGVHPALLAALARKLGVRGGAGGGNQGEPLLPAEAVRVVRKSFDARANRGAASGKAWAYVLDVDSAALAAAGLKRLQERPGQVERQQQPAEPAAEGASSSAAAAAGEAAGRIPASQAAAGRASTSSDGPGGSSRSGGREREAVVVVGSGPAGLFAALELAEAGIKVVLLERGQPVEVRGKDIGALFVRRKVNPESNVCYGEGGAGTWSDGKLTTRIGRNSDPVRRVLDTLFRFGAPESVLVSGKPHLGTDRLVRILKAFREHLISLGCDIRFGTKVDDIVVANGRLTGVRLADGTVLPASRVILAPGHSARELYRSLLAHDVCITPKPFAVGFRIEHPQELIDRLQYGPADSQRVQRGKGDYPVAEYRLAAEISAAAAAQAAAAAAAAGVDGGASGGGAFVDDWYQPLLAAPAGEQQQGEQQGVFGSARGVYSFCMCPGGQVVPTSTKEGELCINGMSFSRRDSKWANSALVVAVQPGDWAHLEAAHGPLAGMALQQQFEREAALRGGGSFVAPAQRVTDFVAGQAPSGPLPPSSYRLGVKATSLHDFYPPHMTAAFVAALARFDRQLPGFVSDDALLHAAETRTSAPLRIDRSPDSLQSLSLPGLYPCGEGAGYAGGIVSSAVDGLRVGGVIVSELTGQAVQDAAAFKVSGGY